MKKWEVCYIDQTVIKNPGIGKKTCALQALLLTPKGTSVIGQTEGFREDDYKERDRLREQLIAQLGLDGWEPMPITHSHYGEQTTWYFKRPLLQDKETLE